MNISDRRKWKYLSRLTPRGEVKKEGEEIRKKREKNRKRKQRIWFGCTVWQPFVDYLMQNKVVTYNFIDRLLNKDQMSVCPSRGGKKLLNKQPQSWYIFFLSVLTWSDNIQNLQNQLFKTSFKVSS